MVVPVLSPNQTSVNAYLPQGKWFDFSTGALLQTNENVSQFHNVSAPLNASLPLFLRAGYAIAVEDTTGISSSDDLNSHFNLTVGLLENHESNITKHTASGLIVGMRNFSDWNVTKRCILDNCLLDIDVDLEEDVLEINFKAQKETDRYTWEAVRITQVNIYGYETEYAEGYVFVNSHLSKAVITIDIARKMAVIKFLAKEPAIIGPGSKISLHVGTHKHEDKGMDPVDPGDV